jgi:hypothetical protein
MIHFNQKPGFFQSWPIFGWSHDSHGRALAPQRSKTKHIKLIVDATYDGVEDEKVKALAVAFHNLFEGENVIGPDGEPMKLGEFAKLETPALLKAGTPNQNGDLFPENVGARAEVSMGCSVRKDECSICNDNVIRERKHLKRRLWYLYASLAGGAVMLAFEVVAAWLGRDFLLNWIVANICQVW